MKKLFSFLIILMLTFSPVLSCFCTETDNSGEVVKVAVIDYPNYLMMEEDGSVSGYAYEYLMEIQKHTGWKFDFIEMSFADATRALTSGEIDILAGNQYTEGRAKLWDYSKRDMGESGTVLCTLPENNTYAFNDFESYGGMRIGALKKTARIEQTREKLSEYGAEAEFAEYDTDAEAKEALKNGEVDAILMSTIRCESAYKIISRINSTPQFFCTNKKKPQLKTELDKAMDEIHLDHPYYEEDLDKKYYGNVITQSSLSKAEIEYVKNSDPIVVAISTDMSPVEYYDEKSGTYKGIVVDALKTVSDYSGLTFEFIPRQSATVLNSQLQTGQIQLVSSVVCSEEFDNELDVTASDPYYMNSIVLVAKSGASPDAELDGNMIVKQGYPFFKWVAQKNGYTNIRYADTFDECLDAVKHGNAEYTLVSANSVGTLLGHAYYENLDSYSFPSSNYEFGFGVSNYADPMLLSIINKAVDSISDEDQNRLLIDNIGYDNENMTARDFLAENNRFLLIAALIVAVLITIMVMGNTHKIKRLNKQLSDEAVRADEYSKAKSDLLSSMSHDMRTPLNAIIGFSSKDLTQNASRDELIDYGDKINISAKYLLTLINDVLSITKIEHGQIKYILKKENIDSFFKELETIIRPNAEAGGIAFTTVRHGINAKYLIGDRLHVQQILMNVLNNAIKFTNSGGKVQLDVEIDHVDGDKVYTLYTVSDTGIGMSAEFLQHIFEPFTREGVSSQPGTGLGLCIVKQLVDGLGGTISVESTQNVGSTFRIVIPFTKCSQEDENKAKEPSDIVQTNLDGRRILLCEDQPLNVQIAVKLLEKKNVIVETAENGQMAVEKFSGSNMGYYDAILMDIRMPKMDGLEATREIRGLQRADAKTIPIIAMSANAYEEDIQKSYAAGMDAHLSKPIEPEIMYNAISELLSNSRNNQS